MDNRELKQMPIDELWALHEEVRAVLTARIAAEKRVLEERLDQLDNQTNASQRRRPYPPVKPKFRNPGNPADGPVADDSRVGLSSNSDRGKRMEDLQIQGAE
jgi:DNA-binding protein H-NS